MTFHNVMAGILLMAFAASTANGAVITLNESGLDLLYGQMDIDIRYNAPQTIYNSALLSIDDGAEFNALESYGVGGNVISMFFVDSINFCGAAIPGIVGCAPVPGNFLALDSSYISTQDFAVTAMGHEIGHDLGLDHYLPDDGTNLMNPTTFDFNPSILPAITVDQRTTILGSSLVQTEALTGQKFISITPFLVASDQVPEPATWTLMGLGLLGVAAWKRRGGHSF